MNSGLAMALLAAALVVLLVSWAMMKHAWRREDAADEARKQAQADALAAARREVATMEQTYDVALGYLRDVAKEAHFLIGLRQGINPHVLDPEKYGPLGMARGDEEKHRAMYKQAQSVQAQAEDDELRQAEEHYFRTVGRAAELGMGSEEISGLSRQQPR